MLLRLVFRVFPIYNELTKVGRDGIYKSVKVRDVIKFLEADGWYLVAIKGSHRQYEHPVKSGKVTLPGKPGDDVAAGTLASIRKQAKLQLR